MNQWAYILTPLLTLPIVALFRFVGCHPFSGADAPAPPSEPATQPKPPSTPVTPPVTTPPRYRDYIMGVPNNPGQVKNNSVIPDPANVIAYWRLIEQTATIGVHDEKVFSDGVYVQGQTIDFELPAPPDAGSDFANGDFQLAEPGLIVSEPTALGRYFNGGYVRVPYVKGLYSDEFTIEAWVLAPPHKAGFEYTLFHAGGNYASPPSAPPDDHGFHIFENSAGRWQIRLAPGFADLLLAPPLIPRPGKTHVAVTMQNQGAAGVKQVRVYVDGKESASVPVATYARPDGAPLFIGVENRAADPVPSPTNPAELHTPALMQIQEVVIHSKALSLEEIQNHVDINR